MSADQELDGYGPIPEHLDITRRPGATRVKKVRGVKPRSAITIPSNSRCLPVKLVDPPLDMPHRYLPIRAHALDAGIDLHAARTRYIERGEITGIPLGVAVAIPEGHVGLLTLRSSLGRKGVAMANGVGVIDSGYRGELIALVTAWDDDPPRIEAGDRIAQLLVVPIATPAVEIVDILPASADGRGTDGFGSTGR